MTEFLVPFRWFFGPQVDPNPFRVILWWELRRIPINLIIFVYGFICLIIFFWGILNSGTLQPGEDAVEPIALIVAPVAFNICYTLGWIVEVPLRWSEPQLSPRIGPVLLALGLAFSLCIITLPAAIWGGYHVLQLLGVLR